MGSIINAGAGSAGGVGAGVGGLIGGIVGANNSSGDFQNANEAAQKAAQQLIATGMPPDLAKQVVLQQYQSAGKLTPEMEQAMQLGPSAVANIQTDPTTRNAQMAALQQYQQASQTGQTAQDQLNNQKMVNQVNSDAQSRNASIIQGAQARGESGSGASLAAQLANAQGAANNESSQGLQLAANANNARLAALSGAASLGGQINNQDFSQANTKANAADQFQRFNVQNQQNVANANTTAANQAQAANLANAQQLQNANTGQNNQEALRENQAQLTDWQAQNQRNNIINQGYNQSAGNYQNQGNAVANQAAQMGASIGGILGSGASAATSTSGAANKADTQGNTASDSSATSGTGNNSAFENAFSPAQSGDTSAGGAGDMSDMGDGMAFAAHGGLIQNLIRVPVRFDQGGVVPQQQPMQMQQMAPQMNQPGQAQGQPQQYAQSSPQQRFLPPTGVLNASRGATVPGRATVPGDSYANDKIHAMLSPDEIVLPRSITTRHDAPERAMEFVKGILAAKKHQG